MDLPNESLPQEVQQAMSQGIPVKRRDDSSVQSVLNDINASTTNVPMEVIGLPSEGKYYPSNSSLSTGKISLRYPTARDEDILVSRNLLQKGIALDMFIGSLIVDKNVNLDDLLLGDKNALTVAARILAYGTEYDSQMKCPSCGELNKVKIDLSTVETKEVELSGDTDGNHVFILPLSKAEVVFKLLDGHDLKKIDEEIKQFKKRLKGNVEPESTIRLKYAIKSINGENSLNFIHNFVNSMPSQDALKLRDQIHKLTPDMDMIFDFECSECSYSERSTIPLGVSFFWPSGIQNR